jgi:hypothetical protein
MEAGQCGRRHKNPEAMLDERDMKCFILVAMKTMEKAIYEELFACTM